MSELTHCANCGAEFKSSLLKTNKRSEDNITSLLNFILDKNSECFCDSCITAMTSDLQSTHKELESEIKSKIHLIPIVTTHTPQDWDYIIKGIVTGQTVMGTGIISEFKSSITDIFGLKSNSFTNKIAIGEKDCFFQLRMKALNLEANAIIATDIDYSDVGGGKNMIMVCAAGTAVEAKHIDVGKLMDFSKKINALEKLRAHYQSLNKILY